ncbi:MAG: hypothetical protein ACFFCQ_15250 [Promethearchaeota archaeon]
MESKEKINNSQSPIKPTEKKKGDIKDYIYNRKYWISKLLIYRSNLLTFLVMFIVSFGSYFLGMGLALFEFDEFTYTGNLSEENLDMYLDMSSDGWGREMVSTPLFLFAHLIMLWVVGNNLRNALLTIPMVIEISDVDLKKKTNRLINNWYGLIIAAPFILYDVYFSMLDFNDPEEILINPLVHGLTTAIWVIEWYIFGCVLYSLLMFLNFTRTYTIQYEYAENLFVIVLEDKLRDLVYMGHKIAFALGFYFITSVIFMILVEWWLSDVLAFIIMLILLPIITIVPIHNIESSLKKEQQKMLDNYFNAMYISLAKVFINSPHNLDVETKLNFLINAHLKNAFQQRKFDYLMVYVKLIGVLMIPVSYLIYTLLYIFVDRLIG